MGRGVGRRLDSNVSRRSAEGVTVGRDEELDALVAAERRLRAITEHAPDFILHFDRAGVISYMNRPAPGHSMADMLGTNVRKWMEPQFHDAFGEAVERVFATGELASYESVGTVTGTHYINRISPVLADGKVESAVLITHDITELKHLQQRAEESEERYRTLVESSFEGLIISVDRVAIYANQAVADIFGYSLDELAGKSPATMATPESQELIAKNVRAGIETPYEVTCIRKDGSTFPCELLGRNTVFEGKPARITGFRDLTERRAREAEQERREERVRHAQKLETLGVLAGGIAHDFNNLLTIIMANAGIAARTLDQPGKLEKNLDQIREAVMRSRDLTHQLLVYAGQGTRDKERVRLTGLVQDAMELLRVSVSKKANLQCELDPDLPPVDADAGQLRQIVMNLIINASDALDGDSGDVVIKTGVTEANSRYLAGTFAGPASSPGTYVYLAVEDTGKGMTPDTMRRIFDPFFTTKVEGRGLGLAAVQGIVHAHGGAIKVDTELGKGTAFRVLLPAADEANKAVRTPAGSATKPLALQGTVLVADDESGIVDVLRDALCSVGCQVLTAADGEQAVNLFRDNMPGVDLLLLDLTMPKKSGLEALAEIRALDPSVPAILASGYSSRAHEAAQLQDPQIRFLSKPYDLETLLDLVGETLAPA